MFISSIPLLFALLAVAVSGLPSGNFERQTTSPISLDSYEYIVVGSGPGGGPLAARLAIAGHSVLLLDAGDDQGAALQYQVPAFSLLSTEYEPMRWDYYVNHYSNATQQLKDSKMSYRTTDGGLYVGLNPPAGAIPLGILYPRAGTLGGCGSHNALISIYPHNSDWTYIASLTGDSSWSPTNMRKYFVRMENAEYLTTNGVSGHGFNGWYTTSVTDLLIVLKDFKLLSLVAAAGTALGKGVLGGLITTIAELTKILVLDINSDLPTRDATEGLYQVPIAVDGGARNGPREFVLSTANALNSDGSRKYKLDVRLNTLVTKVRFSSGAGAKPRAVGVDFLAGQSLYRADRRSGSAAPGTPGSVNATREVILAAGAFNTPQLLKLSGIGPAAELSSFNIPVVVDLPGVGTNLQDRYEASIVGTTATDFSTSKDCTFMQRSPDPCLTQWQNNAGGDRGIYASNGISLAVVKKSTVADSDPDLLIAGAPVNFRGYYPGYSKDSVVDSKHWSWIPLKAHSRNRAGTVSLASTDARDMPLINFRSFDDSVDGAKDVQAVYEGMELSRKMFSSVNVLAGTFTEIWPGPAITGSALKEFIRNEAWGHHASCTCPIGTDSDPLAVLDSAFRVRGTSGLRVVDASVFPKIPGFYIAVPIYMISEKASDVILADAV